MSGPAIGRDALEAEEKELEERVAQAVRVEQALEQQAAQAAREREQAVGALIVIRRVLGKPPTGEVVVDQAPEAKAPAKPRRRRTAGRSAPRKASGKGKKS